MSLFDSTTPSSDPAADFLARDNEQLASLGILDAPKSDPLTNGGFDAAFSSSDPFGEQPMTASTSDDGTTAAASTFDKLTDAGGATTGIGDSRAPVLDLGANLSELMGLGVAGDSLTAPIRSDSPPPTLQEVPDPEPDTNPFLADQAGASGFADVGFGFGTGADTSLLDGGAGASDAAANGFAAAASEQQAAADRFSALREADKERKLSPKVLAWQEKQKERIANKDAEEEKKKQELREQAKRELSDWYRHYEEQIQLANQRNQEAENAFLEEREESVMAAGQDATPTGGAAWERVARLCDFNPKNSKCTKDVSRFRGMLLQLKSPSGGVTADGAAFN